MTYSLTAWKENSFQISSAGVSHRLWCLRKSVCVNELRQWRQNQSKSALLGAQPSAMTPQRCQAYGAIGSVHRARVRGAVRKLWEIVCTADKIAARQTARVSDHTLVLFAQTAEDKDASQEVLGLSPVGSFTGGTTPLVLYYKPWTTLPATDWKSHCVLCPSKKTPLIVAMTHAKWSQTLCCSGVLQCNNR